MVFYQWWGASWAVGLLVCLRAAVGDGLLVVALYGAGCAVFRHRGWILRPGAAGYLFLAATGIALAVVVELSALASRRWAYSGLMPVVPLLGVGLIPLLQMALLPSLTARLSRPWLL